MKYALILLTLTTLLVAVEQETPSKKFFRLQRIAMLEQPETDPTVRITIKGNPGNQILIQNYGTEDKFDENGLCVLDVSKGSWLQLSFPNSTPGIRFVSVDKAEAYVHVQSIFKCNKSMTINVTFKHVTFRDVE